MYISFIFLMVNQFHIYKVHILWCFQSPLITRVACRAKYIVPMNRPLSSVCVGIEGILRFGFSYYQ